MLKQRAVHASSWSAVEIGLRQGLPFLASVLLARLLVPAEFGAMASLALFLALGTIVADAGLGFALIQHREATHEDESSVFWFQCVAGAGAAAAVALLSPWLADFYGVPELARVGPFAALSLLFGAVGAIHSTLLSKELDFRTQAKASAVAAAVSCAITLALAWRGAGIWALAAQPVAMSGVNALLLWAFTPWRPRWAWSVKSLQALFSFGAYHAASNLLDAGYSRLYTVLVGRVYGVRDLGYYNQAEITRQVPSGLVTSVLVRVALPVFSAIAHSPAQLRRGMQMTVRATMLINAPVMLGVAVVAEPAVRVLFGDAWLPVVPLLRILALAGLLIPLHVINLFALMAQGRSAQMFRLEVAKKALGIALIALAAPFGLEAIAWSQVAFSAAALLINAKYSRDLLGYGVIAQLRDCARIGLAAGAMAAGVACAAHFQGLAPLPGLLVLSLGGALAYVAFLLLLRDHNLRELFDLLRLRATLPEKPA